MTAKTISAYKARTRFGELIDEVRYKNQPYIIKKNGRPVVVIIDIEQFKKLTKKFIWPIRRYTTKEIQEFLKKDTLEPELESKVKRALNER